MSVDVSEIGGDRVGERVLGINTHYQAELAQREAAGADPRTHELQDIRYGDGGCLRA